MDGELQKYLSALTRKLKLDPRTNSEIVFELQCHLEEKIVELQEDGLTYEEARQRAVQDLGQPELIAEGMYSVHSKGSWRDIAVATLPHLLLASLFALHLSTRYLLIAGLVAAVTGVTFLAWRSGRPKWTYTWLGYSMMAPAVSWLMALVALGYATWMFLTTGALPFSLPVYLLIAVYVPFSLWVMGNMVLKVVRQDWLLASLTALPFPFLTSWILFPSWPGGPWAANSDQIRASDSDRALVFLALAVTTGVFLKLGHRMYKIALLTISTALLVVFTAVAVPVGLGLLSGILVILASVAFLLSPAVIQSRLERRERSRQLVDEDGEVVTHWFRNAG